MAGNIDGYFHDNVLVRGSEMAKITNALAGKQSYVVAGYAQGMNITTSGLNVTVQPGFAVIQGYPVVIKQSIILNLPANSSGYVVITIDKSKDVIFEGSPDEPGTYSWENNQVALEFVTSLTNGDLMNDDAIFTFSLAQVTTNATSASVTKNNSSYTYVPNFSDGLKSKGVNVRNDTENESIFLKANLTKTGGFNDLTETGVYIISDGSPGGTSTDTFGCIFVIKRSGQSCTQMFIGAVTNQLWIRSKNGGTWNSWAQK